MRGRALYVALLVACLAVLAYHVLHGVRVTRDLVSGPLRARSEAAEVRFACLADRVRELVPPGAPVHIVFETGPAHEIVVLHEQADRWARLVERPGPGVVTLSAREDAPSAGCDGVVVEAAT